MLIPGEGVTYDRARHGPPNRAVRKRCSAFCFSPRRTFLLWYRVSMSTINEPKKAPMMRPSRGSSPTPAFQPRCSWKTMAGQHKLATQFLANT